MRYRRSLGIENRFDPGSILPHFHEKSKCVVNVGFVLQNYAIGPSSGEGENPSKLQRIGSSRNAEIMDGDNGRPSREVLSQF
jgi:hypothetical protein